MELLRREEDVTNVMDGILTELKRRNGIFMSLEDQQEQTENVDVIYIAFQFIQSGTDEENIMVNKIKSFASRESRKDLNVYEVVFCTRIDMNTFL